MFVVPAVQLQSPLLDRDRPPGQPDQQRVLPHTSGARPPTSVAALLVPTARLLPAAAGERRAVPDLQHALLRRPAARQPAAARESPAHQGNSAWR